MKRRVELKLVTEKDKLRPDKQIENFEKIQTNCLPNGILFSWDFEDAIHARHIVTDTGWKIVLDRGLDIFLRYEMSDPFALSNRLQKFRTCRDFYVTYLRV